MISELGAWLHQLLLSTHTNSPCNLQHVLTDSHAQSAEGKQILLITFPFQLPSPALYAADNSREHKLMQKDAQAVKKKGMGLGEWVALSPNSFRVIRICKTNLLYRHRLWLPPPKKKWSPGRLHSSNNLQVGILAAILR